MKNEAEERRNEIMHLLERATEDQLCIVRQFVKALLR